eukprot:1137770-Pelagomonas_calceolata.AAC.10
MCTLSPEAFAHHEHKVQLKQHLHTLKAEVIPCTLRQVSTSTGTHKHRHRCPQAQVFTSTGTGVHEHLQSCPHVRNT